MWVNIYAFQGPENIRSIIVWCFCLLGVLLLGANVFLPNNDVNIFVDTIILVLGLAALGYYIGQAAKAIWTGSRDEPDYLIVGIALSWISQDSQAVLRIVTRLTNFDPVWVNSEFFLISKMLTVVAAVLHIIPKNAIKGEVPKGNVYVVSVTLALSIALAVTILVVRPDPRPFIRDLPWWTRDAFGTGTIPNHLN